MSGENRAKPEVEKKRWPTIVDIANRAGVAPMTVSRVIKESGYVSPLKKRPTAVFARTYRSHRSCLHRQNNEKHNQYYSFCFNHDYC